MMGASVLMGVLVMGIFAFGEFNYHAHGERSAGNLYPLRQRGISPMSAPQHAPQSHTIPSKSSFYSGRSPSAQQNPNMVPASAPSPSPRQHLPIPYATSIAHRRTTAAQSPSPSPSTAAQSPSPSPSILLPRATRVAPVASMSTSLQKTNPPVPSSHEIQHLKVLILVVSIFATLLLGAILLCAYCIWVCRRHSKAANTPSQPQGSQKQYDSDSSDANKGLSFGPLINRLSSFRIGKRRGCASAMDYSILQAATQNFSSHNVLGKGGFGCVYRAQFQDGFCAAVKELDEERKQIENEFESEVELMSNVRHPNLVSLLGFCAHGKKRLLVYELMQNGSLEDQLHGPSRGSALTWYLRLKIALDVARGLEHLHEQCDPPIIHCDLKSSNILFDASFNAKLSDFGLAITTQDGMDRRNIEVLGTLGYVAPEFLLDGKLTEKSDVYAFGVVLLELITGRKSVDKAMPTGCQSLVTWAKPQLTDRTKLPTIVDPLLKETMNLKHLYQVAAVAVLCVQYEPGYRPLIADVVHSLIPLVPVELGGALRNANVPQIIEMKALVSTNLRTKTSHPEL